MIERPMLISDNPTLFSEVLRRAEERRAALTAAVEQHELAIKDHEKTIARYERLLTAETQALLGLQRELATLEHVVEPLAAQEWCNTEKAQPSSRPEPRRTRRTLQELVFSAVAEHPGQSLEFLAEILTKRRRLPTDAGLVKTILHAHPDKVEWRDGWYPAAPEILTSQDVRCAGAELAWLDAIEGGMHAGCEAHTAPSSETPAEIPEV